VGLDRRVIVALLVIALILAPAAVLRAVCAGHSCDEPDEGSANVPFCSLADARRERIVAGFREGRSPDILTVPNEDADERVPVVFAGAGIASGASIPGAITLDSIAPTIAEVIGFERPHPEVRSGTAIAGVAEGEPPGLVILIVVEGLSGDDLDDPALRELAAVAAGGVAADDVDIGSDPRDRAAVAATIGTGGLPSQHGITGSFLRNDSGKFATAWGPGSPVSVIATLGDDMDELLNQKPRIGLVAPARIYQGLIGGNWYVENDKDPIRIESSPEKAAAAVSTFLRQGFGDDATPDVLAVALAGRPTEADKAIGAIADAAEGVRTGATVVVTGTGPVPGDNGDVVDEIERSIPGRTSLIEGTVAGGFFVDQAGLTKTGTTEDQVIDAVKETGDFADAFAAITVEFARYC
jgi:hypothetical protein